MANRRFIDFPIASTVGDNDIVLIWQDGANKQTTKATILSGLPENLEDLNDVVISGLTNGQILRYDSVTGKWENTDQGNLDLNDLNDVSIVSPSNGQVLVYNSSTSKWENSSGGFVPYVGAVTTVDLGAQGLRAGYVRFDTSVASVPDEQGLMYWDDSRSTAALIMNGTLQHIGQDTFFYVKNSSGSNIPKGTCVRFAGTDGASGHLLIAPFLANGSVPSSYFMGVTAEAIANGSFGQVMHFGELEGINTSGFTAGALLYASTTVAGAFQTTAPVAPNNIVLVAAAINSKNNGAIIVRPQIGSNINNDEGVKITSVANLDLLQYQSGTGLWENKTLAQVIGSAYVPSTRTITINGTTQDLSANRTYNVGTVTSVGLSSATSGVTIGSTPVTTSGTITLAIATASGSQNGLLSSTDWTTFNNKQNALTNPVTGTGASGQVAYFNGTTTITSESNLFWDATNDRLGIGTSSPTERLEVNGNGLFSSSVKVNTSGVNTSLNAVSSGLQLVVDGSTGSNRNITFNIASTEAMRIDNNLNLGLGVTPSAWSVLTAMQIKGGAFISGYNNNTYVGANWYFDGSVGRYLNNDFATSYIQTDGEHQWLTATSGTAGNAISFTQAMTLTSGGNLLVGTTSDNGARLQVSGAATFSSTLRATEITASMPSGNGALYINNSSLTNKNWTFIPQTSSGETDLLLFYTGAAAGTRLTVTSSGNVGIGTASPGLRLHVSTTAAEVLRLQGTSGGSTNNTQLRFFGSNANTDLWAIGSEVATGSTDRAFDFYDLVAGANRMRITSSGLLGIGTNNPTRSVQITRASTAFINAEGSIVAIGSSDTELRLFGNNTETMTLKSGNVGIGTASPNRLLTMYSATIPVFQLVNPTTGTTADDGLLIYQNGVNAVIENQEAGELSFRTSASPRMTITSSGNVGIGTTTASSALSGSARVLAIVDNATANLGSVRVYGGGTATSLELYGGASAVGLFGSTNHPMVFSTNSTERMRITSGGFTKASNTGSYSAGGGSLHEFNTNQNDTNVAFFNTASTLNAARAGIDVLYVNTAPNNTTAAFYQAADNAGGRTLRFEVRSNGGIANFSANNVALSDIRTKKNILPLESYWEKFKALEIVKFKYKDQTHDDFNIGVIAQQVEKVAPEFVDVDGWDGIAKTKDVEPLKSIYTADLYNASIKVLQEALLKIEKLEAEIYLLKN